MSDVPEAAIAAAAGAMQAREHIYGENRWRENAKVAVAAAMPHILADAVFYMEGVKAERERIRQRLVCCRECGEIHGDAAHAEHYPEGEYDHPGNAPWQAAGPGALDHLDKLLGDGPVP